jgi:hypothetical protein
LEFIKYVDNHDVGLQHELHRHFSVEEPGDGNWTGQHKKQHRLFVYKRWNEQRPSAGTDILEAPTGHFNDLQRAALSNVPHLYGNAQTETYTVLDQSGKVMTEAGMTASENILYVISNPKGYPTFNPKPVGVNTQGQFLTISRSALAHRRLRSRENI